MLNVLLRRHSDHEGRDVNHLLADSDVSLTDKNTGVMDRGGELAFGNEGLKTSLHELGQVESKDVIELSLRLLEESKSYHALQKCLACT